MTRHVPTEEDKQKMQLGRKAKDAVDAYLTFVNSPKKRGRKADPQAIQEKIDTETSLANKVILIAQLHAAVEQQQMQEQEQELEFEFLTYVTWFSEQHNITYHAWREIGVQANVLAKAGITS